MQILIHPRARAEIERGLDRIARLVFEIPADRFVFAVLFAIWLKTGFGVIGNQSFAVAIARNPFINPIGPQYDQQYLMWTWLGPFLGWVLGATSWIAYTLLCGAFSAAFVVLFCWLAFRRLGDVRARAAIIHFAMLPCSTTPLYWISNDGLTLLLFLSAFAVSRWPAAVFFVGWLLGLQHFEQAFVGSAALIFAAELSERFYDAQLPCARGARFALIAGAIMGKLTLVLLFWHYHISIPEDRVEWAQVHLPNLLKEFERNPGLILWSVCGVGWLAAARYSREGRGSLPFFLALFGMMLMLPIVGDQTRVISICSFPLFSVYWLFNSTFLSRFNRRDVAAGAVIWILVPWIWVWGSHVQTPWPLKAIGIEYSPLAPSEYPQRRALGA